jgi:pimeloyl-ACP methyl ester carboxylesterase
MIPKPGERGGEWWANVGCAEAIAAQGLPDDSEETLFLHDVPPEVLAASDPPRDQTGRVMEDPWPLDAWPDVPTSVLSGRDDRFFPPDFQRRLAAERLGCAVEEIPGGHLAALSRPVELADYLTSR